MTRLLIVDDDADLRAALAENFSARGIEVRLAANVTSALRVASEFKPEWVLADLSMPGESGLALIPQILALDPAIRIVVLTGYATIATAIEAIKLGAWHYLAKPVSSDEIIAAFERGEGDAGIPVSSPSVPLNIAERDHIAASLTRNRQNISATARELGMHRRTLQRKIEKMRLDD